MSEPTLHRVELTLCSLCLDGAGGECHVPGCALWINRAPDLSLRGNPMVASIDGMLMCRRCYMTRATLRFGKKREQLCHGCALKEPVIV